MAEKEEITINTREVAVLLAFLVGRTILFRESSNNRSSSDDATVATKIKSIKVSNSSSSPKEGKITIYTDVGQLSVSNSKSLNDIMVLDNEGCGKVKSIGEYADRMGIVF